MHRNELFLFLERLALPLGEWVVFGGACLAAHGIRATKDVDLFVTPQLYQRLQDEGWEARVTNSTSSPYLLKVVGGVELQAFIQCGSEEWVPKVQTYFNQPERINGFSFMPLKEMYAWKDATRRPKDISDLALIEAYWQQRT
jgi:hypothetical protein